MNECENVSVLNFMFLLNSDSSFQCNTIYFRYPKGQKRRKVSKGDQCNLIYLLYNYFVLCFPKIKAFQGSGRSGHNSEPQTSGTLQSTGLRVNYLVSEVIY